MFPNALMRITTLSAALAVAALLAFAGGEAFSADEAKPAGPKVFETPEAAVEAMLAAVKANDDAALKAIAGPARAGLIQDGSDPGVAKDRAEFAAEAKERLKIQDNEDGTKTVVVGDQRWPFPIPLKKVEGGWIFDLAAGGEEMLARRVGRNELRAIDICRKYARAQVEYASKDRDGDQVREYAQKILSTAGKKDGLYWPDVEGEDQSPFGPFVTAIQEVLGDREVGGAVGGYVWRILTGQGSSAPGGRHSYIINGNMIAGFALVGTPAVPGETGIMTFLVSHHGRVYEKALGANGLNWVQRCLKGYNPDATWNEVDQIRSTR